MKHLNPDLILNISGVAEKPNPDKVERDRKRFMRVKDAKLVKEFMKKESYEFKNFNKESKINLN